jgi:hypothetical protein
MLAQKKGNKAMAKPTRDRFLKIRLLPSEVTELQRLAKSENLDPSKFVRSRIFPKNIAA